MSDVRTLVRSGLRELGWAMIALGILTLLLAAYLVWGTRAMEARSQASLRHGFDASIAAHARDVRRPHGDRSPHEEGWATSRATVGAIDELRIPTIGLDAFVVDGVSEQDLMLGPGHYPGTAYPGQAGNVAIAGHRTTYGAPFFSLDAVHVGDRILLTDRLGQRFVYRVARPPFVVPPTDTAVLGATSTAQLTLTTCTPAYWATSRLVVVARLDPSRRMPPIRPALDARIALAAVTPTPSEGSQLWLWIGLVAVLWLAIRTAARVFAGGSRVLMVGGAVAALGVVLWFTFASVAGVLPSTI